MNPTPSFGGCAWGIDVAVQHLAFGFVHCDLGHFQTNALVLPIKVGEHPIRRLARLRRELLVFADALEQHFPCCVATVEQPAGRVVPPSLMGTAWCVAEALSDGGRPVYLDTPPMWKKAVGLAGNAGKPAVLAWAKAQGWPGTDEHQADALGLAVAAARSIGACPELTPAIAPATTRRRA